MKKSELRNIIKEEIKNILIESNFKKGNIVIALKGPHKGKKHEIIYIFPNGKVNIKPMLRANEKNKYHLGAATAELKDIKLAENITEVKKEITKKFDKTVTSYQDLLKQKQNMIQKIKDVIASSSDPKKKQELIKKHNTAIKKLNSQISYAEANFNGAVDQLEVAKEEDLI